VYSVMMNKMNNISYNLVENFSLGESVTDIVLQAVTNGPWYLGVLWARTCRHR
jgi:hypothetical protein